MEERKKVVLYIEKMGDVRIEGEYFKIGNSSYHRDWYTLALANYEEFTIA